MTDIGRLVREANPVLDESTALTDDELTALLLLAESRSTDMDVKELVTPVEPEPPRQRGWLMAAASFALILLIVGATIVVGGSDAAAPPAAEDAAPTATAVSPTTTPAAVIDESAVAPEVQEVLDAFLLAVNSGDEAAVSSLIAPGFEYTQSDGEFPKREWWSGSLAYLALEGATFSFEECRSDGNGAVCTESWNGEVLDAVYPFAWTMRNTYTIYDGLILAVDSVQLSGPSNVWVAREQTSEWVKSFDAENGSAMEHTGPGAKTAEQAALWAHYAPIWIDQGRPAPGVGDFAEAMLIVNRLEQAMNSGDTVAIAALLASGFTTSDPDGTSALTSDEWIPFLAFNAAEDVQYRFSQCEPRSSRISCTVDWSGPVLAAVHPWPWQTEMSIAVASGLVTSIEERPLSVPTDETAVRLEMVEWFESQDPEAAAAILETEGLLYNNLEAAETFLEWAPKWVEAGRP